MKYLLPAIIILLPAVIYGEEYASDLASQFSARPIEERTVQNLPKGREEEIYQALEQQKAYSTLLRLNHKPTVDSVVAKYVEAEGRDVYLRRKIEASGSPYIIDELAPALYKNDQLKHRSYGEHGDSDWGESAVMAEVIGQLIIRAPEFPADVRAWAKRELGGPGPNVIQAARSWWETNQTALLANRFNQVALPQTTPAIPVAPPAQPVMPPAPSPETAPAKADISTPLTPAPVVPPLTAQKTGSAWWIAALVAVLGGIWIIVRSRKPRR